MFKLSRFFVKKATGVNGFKFTQGDDAVAKIGSSFKGDPDVLVPVKITEVLFEENYAFAAEVTDCKNISMLVTSDCINDPKIVKANTASIPPSYPGKNATFAAVGVIPEVLRIPETEFETLEV